VGAALAACGGSSPPGATSGSTTTIASSSAGGGANTTGLLAYTACMRSHGVPNFPDPSSGGGIPKQAVVNALRAVSNAQADAAQNACKDLLPAGQSLSGKPVQAITEQQQQYYLKAAACMRTHGITNFPEPTFYNHEVEFPRLEHLVDIDSPQFTQALKACHRIIPAGLPYSLSGG
jgi:hypothetical protein